MKIFGNDRSHWNGISNFSVAYANGARFDISKVSEGANFLDDTFVRNFNGARAQYEVNGAFHYFRPSHNTTNQLINMQAGLAKVDFHEKAILAIDVEETDGLAKSVTASRLKTFVKKARAVYPKNPMMIYTSPYKWGIIGDEDPFWLDYYLWEANTQVNAPNPIPPWNSNWAIWQFSHTGHAPSWGATSQYIDVDIMAKWYWDLVVPPVVLPDPEEHDVIITLDGITYSGKVRK